MGRIPLEIKVGFQYRDETYTKRLGFITSYKSKKKTDFHFQKGFERWIDKNIEVEEHENVPIEGFVIHERAGGNKCWSGRTEKLRVWDPRGWEFEIGMDAIVHILEHADIITGQIQGEFVYGWFGRDGLSLIHKDSDEYKSIYGVKEGLESIKTIPKKDWIVGQGYLMKGGVKAYYLGDYYSGPSHYSIIYENSFITEKVKSYFIQFETATKYLKDGRGWDIFKTSYKPVEVLSENLNENETRSIITYTNLIPKNIPVDQAVQYIIDNTTYTFKPICGNMLGFNKGTILSNGDNNPLCVSKSFDENYTVVKNLFFANTYRHILTNNEQDKFYVVKEEYDFFEGKKIKIPGVSYYRSGIYLLYEFDIKTFKTGALIEDMDITELDFSRELELKLK